MTDRSTKPENLHASAVALGPAGLLIVGASGSGKSSLALELMSRGARLVADDQVMLLPKEEGLRLSPHPRLAGRIEARGVGILEVPYASAVAHWVVTLDEIETARLPEMHQTVIAGVQLPLLKKVESPMFPSILIALLSGGRSAP